MRLVSVNVGLPRVVTWQGKQVTTAIFKEPAAGRITLRTLNLDGDHQADLRVHGGEQKAVYCYPIEHYEYWRAELPGRELTPGNFGENFTTAGLLEDSMNLGDELVVGSTRIVITQPRLPCYKLGIRFQSEDMIKRFLASRRTGFYAAVMREGDVGTGDDIEVVHRDPAAVSVSDITQLFVTKRYGAAEVASARRALAVGALPESWKQHLRERLAQNGA
jgi:MOSC domain-containing protein YiiM